jgi:hypothetical protein
MSETNPIGNAQVTAITDKVESLAVKWDEQIAETARSWWSRISLYKVTRFLLDSLDDLICFVDNLIDSGPDKKATVMSAVEKLYDHVVKEAMPIWLKPFSPAIKNFILNVIVAQSIDFIVNKYREGAWNVKEDNDGSEKTAEV